ncbi:MAG: hypothetical protein HWN67_11840 [Candidatus Helarchaeota archaeon]|nr:hypothetical protein [Candidatus Helarchaeota archaeon]
MVVAITKRILFSSLSPEQCFEKIKSDIKTKFKGEITKISEKSIIFKKGSMKSSKNIKDYPLKGIITIDENEKSKILINFNYIFFIKSTLFWLLIIGCNVGLSILVYFLFNSNIPINLFVLASLAGAVSEIILIINLKRILNKAEQVFIRELNL